MMSAAASPYISSAPRFQLRMMPSRSFAMMASSEESTTPPQACGRHKLQDGYGGRSSRSCREWRRFRILNSPQPTNDARAYRYGR